ncbi:MAG: radical SAM protein, partial [Candidatus Omnitrophica bacterium]|nr:radical SAM protein [Candidatus Omnitrophota bacterium]
TDHCNLKCFFCSNEGMDFSRKNKTHINVEQLKYLIQVLADKGLKSISLTGGEPTMHPRIFDIVSFLNKFNFKNLFFHTNGISLKEDLLKQMSGSFNKVAVSLHSINFNTWQRLTKGTKKQFRKLVRNLRMLSKFTDNFLVELKFIPIKGYNDTEKEFSDFIKLCNDMGFKFKFLKLEPIMPEQIKMVVPFKEIQRRLINVGCQAGENDKEFRGQSNYLPIHKFRYKNTLGVAIEIGCGNPDTCRECHLSNEIFVTCDFKIKPCHMTNYQIDIDKFIKLKSKELIYQAIIDSRIYLAGSPGANFKVWQNNL